MKLRDKPCVICGEPAQVKLACDFTDKKIRKVDIPVCSYKCQQDAFRELRDDNMLK